MQTIDRLERFAFRTCTSAKALLVSVSLALADTSKNANTFSGCY
ncbi:hypothetical protein [Burkholderia vietnamiensis]|nr:hypothetical protein [Burkholderia vietnamiensis]